MNVSPLISNSNNDYSKLDDSISGQFWGFFYAQPMSNINLRGCVWHAKLTKLANHSFTVEKLCLMVVNYIIVNDDNLYFTYVNHG